MSDLFNDLESADRAASRNAGLACTACDWLKHEPPGDRKDAIVAALASTIGNRTLAEILRKHDIPVGREHIAKHRKEGHS